MKVSSGAIKQAFDITGKFEGSGFSNMDGNTDGMYLSYGIFQWNFGMGTLQPLFNRLFSDFPKVAEELLPDGGQWLKLALDNGTEKEWALQIQSNNQIVDPWKSALYNLGQAPEFQQIQIDASQSYIDQGANLCNQYALTSRKAFCLFFDIAVQCWSLKYAPDFSNIDNSNTDPHTLEIAKMTAIVDALVQGVSGEINGSCELCKEDVRDRNMTIVNGYGTVHGTYYELQFPDESAFEVDMTLESALQILMQHHVIDTPDYWLTYALPGGYTVNGAYMRQLILDFTAMYVFNDSFETALNKLVEFQIIDTPDYWAANAVDGGTVDGGYANTVILRMARHLEES